MTYEEYKSLVCRTELSDYNSLLNLGRKWKKIDTNRPYDLRIGVIGSTSLQLTVSVLRALLCKYDIYADLYEGEYNGISMDVFDDYSPLYKFSPSYVVVIPDYRDIVQYIPEILAAEEVVEQAVKKATGYYLNICNKIQEKLPGCQILLANFVVPVHDALGNLGANYLFSENQFYKLVNIELVRQKKSFFTLIDIDSLASYIGKSRWFEESGYYLNKSGFALEYIGFFCDAFARQFEAFIGKIRKCLVLDLDNTLWGGVVGDLGYDGVLLDPNDAEGEAYLEFQKYVLKLKNRGVILAVCSKNDIENAKEPFEKNEHMLLKLQDISAFIANWEDKASNIRAIATKLNIGLDSFVFFDDNPTERALIKEFLPEVKVVEVPEDPALYIRALDQAFCFEWNQLTEEDINRSNSYKQNQNREALLESCDNYEQFLEKLQMQVSWSKVTDTTLPRFSQLTNKSNQFNLRTQRYSEAELNYRLNSEAYELYTVSLKDRFCNYGIIACVVLHYEKACCFIENWVMSCRVLKKTVEHYTMCKIIEMATNKEKSIIKAEFLQSKKNGMVRELLDDFGFTCIENLVEKKEYVLECNQLETYRQNYIMEEIDV